MDSVSGFRLAFKTQDQCVVYRSVSMAIFVHRSTKTSSTTNMKMKYMSLLSGGVRNRANTKEKAVRLAGSHGPTAVYLPAVAS